MKSDISFYGFKINDLVEYSPVGNNRYQWTDRTEGIIVEIDFCISEEDAWISIEQTKDMIDSSCNGKDNYYVIGKIETIIYGKGGRGIDSLKLLKRRARMNSIIIEMFPVTKEAVLVDKWFGVEINKPIFKMLIQGKEKELIAEANRLEEESKKDK